MSIVNPIEQENDKSWKKITMFLGVISYVLVLLFTAAHSWNLLVNAVSEETRWIAAIGFAAIEINAIALPLAIKYWTHTPIHRGVAIIFYALDLVLLYANVIISSALVTNRATPIWGDFYLTNFATASPVFTLVVWSVLWSLDPENVNKDKMTRMIEHARQVAITNTAEYLGSDEFRQTLSGQSDRIADEVIRAAFPNSGRDLDELPEATKQSNGRVKVENF